MCSSDLRSKSSWLICVYCCAILAVDTTPKILLEETHMIDFMINMFSEIADLSIHLGVDKLIDKIAKKPHI